MRKEELEKYKRNWAQWSDQGELDTHVFADIAYQLTRIADQGDEARETVDLAYCKGASEGMKLGKSRADALATAVEEVVRTTGRWLAKTAQRKKDTKDYRLQSIVDLLSPPLAAYRKGEAE